MTEGGGRFRPLRLIISVIITEGAGGIGSAFTFQSIATWYASLNKSALKPPNWIFAPMWLTLYFLMGLALYLIWNSGGEKLFRRLAVVIFAIQLVLNVLWSVIFFWWHSLLFGAVEIVFLWFFIVAAIIEFYQIDRRAAYLLFPYISWVTVATMLNITILFANA